MGPTARSTAPDPGNASRVRPLPPSPCPLPSRERGPTPLPYPLPSAERGPTPLPLREGAGGGSEPVAGGTRQDSAPYSPARFLAAATPELLRRTFADFKHRFATGKELAALLLGAKRLIERHGSLQAAFVAGLAVEHADVVPALILFAAELREAADGLDAHLLPCPTRGSACKRLNLFLRWMVRRDAVDPGGWGGVSPAKLIVPLDVHMHRICRALGLTGRDSADLRTAIEITAAFRAFAPDDPVRYDFALTRLGIRPSPDADLDAFLARWATGWQPKPRRESHAERAEAAEKKEPGRGR
ncbi:MAG: TIGR02757 family protein [Planctomycetes bacterium]|nr:TIGR02757 family protein [Planctomycetota bacterium]